MAKHRGLEFIGIEEHLDKVPSYNYCILDTTDWGLVGARNLQILAEEIADEYGKNFRQKITYHPPREIDASGTSRGLLPRRYHRLSVLEQDRFEKAVLNALKGKK